MYAAHLQIADEEKNEMGCWNLERLCQSLIGVGNVAVDATLANAY